MVFLASGQYTLSMRTYAPFRNVVRSNQRHDRVADCVYDVNGIEHSLFCLFVSLVFADVCDVNGIEQGLFCLFVTLAFAETISRKRYTY